MFSLYKLSRHYNLTFSKWPVAMKQKPFLTEPAWSIIN